jgi:aspartyl-tRNA(Asn)/glutamyl-tRNA(Gln) amidotransferase subunit C
MASEDDIKKLATLARLELDPAFIPVVTGHINAILGYVQRLNDIDTSGVEPMSHVHGAINVLRDDATQAAGSVPDATALGNPTIPAQEMLSAEALLDNAPDHSGRFIRVPLIVE